MQYIIPMYAIFFITSLLMPIAIKSAAIIGIMDCPDERKIHCKPIPRTGGIVIAFSVLSLYFFIIDVSHFTLGYFCAGCIIFVSGIIDDRRNIHYKWKLFLQIVTGFVFVIISENSIDFIGRIIPSISYYTHFLRIPQTVLFIVATINIINLSDGLDALAAGLSIIIFICLSFLGYMSGNMPIVFLSIIMIGSILGFLRFNVFPASVFMGDTGSQFIGYTLGAALVSLTLEGSMYSPMISLFVLGMPVIDTFYVIYFRVAHGQHPFLPDKNHIHHKLISMGLSQYRSVAIIYLVHFFLIICGWILRMYSENFILTMYIIIFFILFIMRKFLLSDDFMNSFFFSKMSCSVHNCVPFNPLCSRFFFSKIVWKLFFLCLGCYYFSAPLLSEKIDSFQLMFFFCAFIIFFTLYFSRFIVNKIWIKIFFYIVSLFVIIYFRSVIFLPFGENVYTVHIHDLFFIVLTIIYILCVIFSPEKAPVNSIDYIFIAFIIFVFFIPDSMLFIHKFKSIIIKTTLLGFFINLVFSRIERNKIFVFSIFIYLFISVAIKLAIINVVI